ncbi:MAG: repressor protein [Candidatus Nealsonbacteria bacterium RIFOXYB1_FULL_40_15]|uniref:Repressor protein n=2 Tax=Candidatus Nealsoniibacteriota TaxID=1817911 RepID=A0A1G2ELH2_9BACT|nr:MAG: repressor protein [Candidatus Nealsonbacteria bacterium RIFOXYC1_FULL_40_7]OGZ26875.1 MAG: repressor protein [Candidatus Nealsonbacteria bacterium RIFOXYB1_FULL_40_15]
MLGKFILEQRKKHDLTQDFLASKIGVSRPTYVQIEQGERDLTITEARKLADIFGIVFDDFVQGKDTSAMVEIKKGVKKAKEDKQEMRISVPQKNLQKFKEVLLYVLSKVGGKPNVGEAVVYKLLYFIDFDFYEKFEEQLVGATYIKNHYGPTPVEFKTIIDDMIENGEVVKVEGKYFNYPQRKYLPIREPDLTKLKDARELRHIDEVIARLGDKNATELSEYSHEDTPWLIAKENQPLDYEAVFYRTPKTSVRNYDEQD